MCHRLNMGVPNDMEGPPRKKCKLSLQAKRREQSERQSYSQDEEPQAQLLSDCNETQSTSGAPFPERHKPDSYDSIAKSPAAPELPVAPVATLHNLGNTCFLNCILQILRYTPNFLSGLAALKEKIQSLEDVLDKDENRDDILKPDTQRTWRFVKDIHQMYQWMDDREASYSKNPGSQSSQMAVRPSTVLNSIRELNPMFEGNFQHDAQELLRCLLCYMEDAEKDVRKTEDENLTQDSLELESSSSACPLVKTEAFEKKSCISARANQASSGASTAECPDQDGGSEARPENLLNGPCTARGRPTKPFKLKGGAPSNRTSRRRRGGLEILTSENNKDIRENVEESKRPPKGRTNGVGEKIETENIVRKLIRGVKRKRSRQEGGDADLAAVVVATEKAEAKPLASVLMNGVAATKRKLGGNGPSIVGFLRKVKDKLVPNSSTVSEQAVCSNTEERESNEFVSSKLPATGSTSVLQSKSKKRMGMTGFVVKHDRVINESSDCTIVHDNVDHRDLQPGGDCQKSQNDKLNDVPTSSSVVNSHHGQDLKPASQTSCISHTPLSPTCGIPLTPADDEITLTSDSDLPCDVDQTVDPVAKSSSSSLPRQDLKWASPGRECEKNGENTESVETRDENLTDPKSDKQPSPGIHSLTPGKDFIVHSPSPSKSGNSCKHKPVFNTSKCRKALNFEPVPLPAAAAFANDEADRDVNWLDFLPKRARQISESYSMEDLKTNLLNLDTSGMTTRSASSAPNTPVGKNKKAGSGSGGEEKNLTHVKINLKRCDWLGVSPTKSVSASCALRNLRLEERSPPCCVGPCKSGAKRNILQDLDLSSSDRHNLGHVSTCGDRVTAVGFECNQGHSQSLSKASASIDCASNLKLKQLSVSVDNCDWMFAKPAPSPISDSQHKMVNGRVKRRKMRCKGSSGVKLIGASCAPKRPADSQLTSEKDESSKMNLSLIERLFGGTMSHLTRCLECERGRERKESFLDISIAVRHLKQAESDDSHGEEEEAQDVPPPSCLASLIRSSSSVERLRDSNKYWCEECLHHVEAERSCHYLDLPQILSLHLKRFKTDSGLFGGLSKLNDKVDIPQELPCLRKQCADFCKDPKHRYQLFAIATHSGLSILHGHYRAFVKVQPSVNPQVFQNLVSYQNGSGNSFNDTSTSWAIQTSSSNYVSSECSLASSSLNHQVDCQSDVKPSELGSVEPEKGENHQDMRRPLLVSPHSPQKLPRTYDKAVKEGKPFPSRRITDFFASAELGTKSGAISSVNTSTSSSQNWASSDEGMNRSSLDNETSTRNLQHFKLEKKCNMRRIPDAVQENTKDCIHVKQEFKEATAKEERVDRATIDKPSALNNPSCYWLECDDECVRVMEEEEFERKLKEADGALLGTPYLLFYHSQGLLPS